MLEVRDEFISLVVKLVMFLHRRLDAPNFMFEYLGPFKDGQPWEERHLQQDLFMHLSSVGYADIEHYTGGGRSDLYILCGEFRFVIEVKRTQKAWAETDPVGLSQSAAYQQTDVRLGVLSILDLSVRPAGTPHFDECFSVDHVTIDVKDRRTVLIMRVPGNRKTPSQA